jgi:phospholipase C
METPIKHVFVVMFENRSFDHMLGFSGIQGFDAFSGMATSIEGIKNPDDYKVEFPSGSGEFYKPTLDAPYSMSVDPSHEFLDTVDQLCGDKNLYVPGTYPPISNAGFAKSFSGCDPKDPGGNMRCLSEMQVPVLNQLAKEFAVCDHWFSSVPGPTWPNRFFLHAATTGGLDDSPSIQMIEQADIVEEFNFKNGTIFDRLSEKGIDWRIYNDDEFAQSYALHKMEVYEDQGKLRPFKKFKGEVNQPDYTPYYTFIEPCYGFVLTDKGSFKCGNSQHPLDDVRHGEKFLKTIYETIRNSPHWETSCLVVTYDEHGGFFDHIPPPKTISPGDAIIDPSYVHHQFSFDQLGVRVPALIISPWIPKNTVDHTIYDHTSILKTLEIWKELDPLTERDKNANSFSHLFSLDKPRKDSPETLTTTTHFTDYQCQKWFLLFEKLFNELVMKVIKSDPISATARGFLHLAFLHNIRKVPAGNREGEINKYKAVATKKDALNYIDDTRKKIKVAESSNKP